MQGTPSHFNMLRPLVGAWFPKIYFTPLFEVLFTFPSVLVRYRSLGVFSLTGWSADSLDFSCPGLLRLSTGKYCRFRVPGIVSGYDFHRIPLLISCRVVDPSTHPCITQVVFIPAFARHYWRNHCYFFLRVLRCSVPRVGLPLGGMAVLARLPHSDIYGSAAICALP